ncbi:glycosyltransferase family 4 protein [Peribacillus sp. SCS-37]|uniref:glycosyltransferase family 4 protein n=1 Tax=Paraperibacillus esterisolvens TaxID=3115296 RepID=UPI00390614CD
MAGKILFCATVDYHFKAFHLPVMKWFKEQGWEVHVAAGGKLKLPFADQKFDIPIQRSPFKLKNIKAYNELKRIIETNKYHLVHCHTPMGGVIGRLAAGGSRNDGTKVVYTAHGFHFCKGAPLRNWLMYYPMEKLLASMTDTLITINTEDYNLAKKKFGPQGIEHVKGVGINTELFRPIAKSEKLNLRRQHGLKAEHFVMFYAAEFNTNKNQQLLIHALASIKDQLPNGKLLLAGEGVQLESCQLLAKTLQVSHMVDFLGYQQDVREILNISDVAVASSLREGLPVNVMEAMSCGLPIIAVKNRGHGELVINNVNGWLAGNNPLEFGLKLLELAGDPELRAAFGVKGRESILNYYGINRVLEAQSIIYKRMIEQKEHVKWAVQ